MSFQPNAREVLTAARTYYVATTGNDANTGLTVSVPFLTIQHAVDVAATLDTSIYNVTIQIADGTYTAAGLVLKQMVGAGSVTIAGNSGTPANVSVVSNSGVAASLRVPATYLIKDLKLSSTGSGTSLITANAGWINFQNLVFGATANSGSHLISYGYGIINCSGDYSITGNAYAHMRSAQLGWLSVASVYVTISNAVAFTYYALSQYMSWITAYGCHFTNPGNVTAQKWLASYLAMIYTSGGGINYFPGNVAGVTENGSYYI